MSTQQIHVFISHSWTYESHYNTLEGWIFNENWSAGQASLDFRNFSVPKNDPIHNASNDNQLREAIFNQISRSHVIVILTGVYASYSRWIQEEIAGAANYGKPILGVNPWAQERKSDVVQTAATKIVGWNKEPIVKGIWELFRS
jgi:MTH538 TIR-like domain (DUF1863)